MFKKNKKQTETIKEPKEKKVRTVKAVSYTHLDVYKRQSIHTKQLVLGLTAFFIPKFQIGVMK